MTKDQHMAIILANKLLLDAGLPSYTQMMIQVRDKVTPLPAPIYMERDSLPAMLRKQAG